MFFKKFLAFSVFKFRIAAVFAIIYSGLYFSIYQTAVLLWMHDPAARDATIIRQCLAADMNILGATEVICSRTPSQLQYLKQIYHSKFGVHLEQDIEAATTGNHKKVRFLCAIFMKGT